MQRLVYRNLGSKQFIVAAHSVDTSAAGGGVRWYQFEADAQGSLKLAQQGTYAPDGGFRWMPSAGMDRKQLRWATLSATVRPLRGSVSRLAMAGYAWFADANLSVLADGKAAQTDTLRWEDYVTLAMDPSDDCTFWYVGDYYKEGEAHYSTKIGSWRLPGCGASGKP